jgi:Ner family transcriptional regulator
MATGWHPEDIKAAVRKRGATLTELALSAGGDGSVCRAALRRPSPVGERLISSFLGVPPQDLWPDRYSRKGERLPTRHVRDEDKRVRDGAHRQIERAV